MSRLFCVYFILERSSLALQGDHMKENIYPFCRSWNKMPLQDKQPENVSMSVKMPEPALAEC